MWGDVGLGCAIGIVFLFLVGLFLEFRGYGWEEEMDALWEELRRKDE